jgi:septal ring factor EnvC (AmiA/AmiB activator)
MDPEALHDLIIETSRDVKCIRESISAIKEKENEMDARIRNLEKNLSKAPVSSLKESQISAGIGAGAGGIVAFLIKLFGG